MALPNKTSFPDPTDYAGFLIWQKSNSWGRTVNSELKKIGLNQAQYFHLISLFYLLNTQKEVTQVGLAEYTGTTFMNTSKIINGFEKIDLIKRQIGKDSRSKSLSITQKGLDVLILGATTMGDLDASFFPETDKIKFINYLKKLN